MNTELLGPPPLALYIHIPWCLKKCPYCDFNSHAFTGELPEAEYIDCLLADLEHDLAYVQDRKLAAIFIGGGTPSLFSPGGMARLLNVISQRLPFNEAIEITMEANPGTFETEKFRGFRDAGINRLSLGIQSFDPAFLRALGRVHDDLEARRAADQARHAGFDNVNLDLMFGLPGQSIQQALADLDTALACEPSHLSWYQLTIEPNTVFYSHPPVLPEDDLLSEMQDAGIDLLANQGYARYEVSAYAQQGRQSHHNLNYWQFGDYLGIGAGAHGKLTLTNEQHILRTRKIRQPVGYLGASAGFTAESQVVPDNDLPLEFLMNALRLCDGVDEALFAARTGQTIDRLQPALDVLRSKDLIQTGRLATTVKGFRFLNDVLEEFLPTEDHKPGTISVKSLSEKPL